MVPHFSNWFLRRACCPCDNYQLWVMTKQGIKQQFSTMSKAVCKKNYVCLFWFGLVKLCRARNYYDSFLLYHFSYLYFSIKLTR